MNFENKNPFYPLFYSEDYTTFFNRRVRENIKNGHSEAGFRRGTGRSSKMLLDVVQSLAEGKGVVILVPNVRIGNYLESRLKEYIKSIGIGFFPGSYWFLEPGLRLFHIHFDELFIDNSYVDLKPISPENYNLRIVKTPSKHFRFIRA